MSTGMFARTEPTVSRLWAVKVKRFRRAEDGSVAVEFGLISVPFFAFLFALIETALIFFASVAMEGAMEDAARLVRTGQAQTQGLSSAQFKQIICDRSPLFFDCADKLEIDVRTFSNFGNVNFPDPLDDEGNLSSTFQFQPGNAGDVVLVRAFYVWDVMTPIGIGLENMSGGNRLLASSAVFRNEPFQGILPGG